MSGAAYVGATLCKAKRLEAKPAVPDKISFPSSDGTFHLHGDVTWPKVNDTQDTASPQMPAIVIIAGSGPIDRNGNVPSVHMTLNTSNRFAEHITASRPIAVLSYDKRGVGKSSKKGDKNLYYRAGMMDLVSDAVEAVRYASVHPRIDGKKILLLGHSEGAIISPIICREVLKAGLDPIFGCIFYAGFGEDVKDAMTLQREAVLEEVQHEKGLKGWLLRKIVTKQRLEKQYNDLMDKINAEDKPDFVSMYCGLAKQPAKWLREHMVYDARDALEKCITCHCLAITGCKDVQVRNEYCEPEQAKSMVPKAASIEAHKPANLTHALRSLDGPSRILNVRKDYTRMGKLPLDPELLSITDSWCDRILFGT